MRRTGGRRRRRCEQMKLMDAVRGKLVAAENVAQTGAVCGLGKCAGGADLADAGELAALQGGGHVCALVPESQYPEIRQTAVVL